MKTYLKIFIITLILLFATFFGNMYLKMSEPLNEKSKEISFNGKIAKEERSQKYFGKLYVYGAFDVELIKSNESKVVIEASEEVLPLIKTDNRENRLWIYSNNDLINTKKPEVKILVYYRSLGYLLAKNATITSKASIDYSGHFFGIETTSAKIDVQLICDDLYVNSSKSHIKIKGKANLLNLMLNRDNLDALDFVSNSGVISLKDSSVAKINIVKVFTIDDADLQSMVFYKGSPSILNNCKTNNVLHFNESDKSSDK